MTTAKEITKAFDEKFIYGKKQEDGSTEYTLATKDKLHDFLLSALRQAQQSILPRTVTHDMTGIGVMGKLDVNLKKFWEGVDMKEPTTCMCGHGKLDHDKDGYCEDVLEDDRGVKLDFCPCTQFTPPKTDN